MRVHKPPQAASHVTPDFEAYVSLAGLIDALVALLVRLHLAVHVREIESISVRSAQRAHDVVAGALERARLLTLHGREVELLKQLGLLLLGLAVVLDHHARKLLDAGNLGIVLGELSLLDLRSVLVPPDPVTIS